MDNAGAKGQGDVIMRYLLLLLLPVLVSCESLAPAIKQYKPITCVDKNGHTYQKMALASSISADLPGLSTLDIGGDIHLTFNNQVLTATTPVYDGKGNVTGTTTSQYATGLYVSHVVDAQGNAVYKCINAGAAGASGILAWIFGAVTTGGIAGAIH